MNKKLLGALGALLLLGSASLFADAAIGLQGGYTPGGVQGSYWGRSNAAVTFKTSDLPMVFAANMSFYYGYFDIGLTADYWITNPEIAGPLHWYTGPGFATSVSFGSGVGIYLAGRWVIGLNVFVIDPLELYIQTAAEIGADIWIGSGAEFWFPDWRVPINVGFRYWF